MHGICRSRACRCSAIDHAAGRALARGGRAPDSDAGDDETSSRGPRTRGEEVSEPARLVGEAVIAAFFGSDKPRERDTQPAEGRNAHRLEAGEPAQLRAKASLPGEQAGPHSTGRSNFRKCSLATTRLRRHRRQPPVRRQEHDLSGFRSLRPAMASNSPRRRAWQCRSGRALLSSRIPASCGEGGAFGLIATNTIGQGDTRETGLAPILTGGGTIYRATKRYQWPNEGAAVVVSVVHIARGAYEDGPVLDERRVDRISA